jgi:hypothetical protein
MRPLLISCLNPGKDVDEIEFGVIVVIAVGGDHGAHLQ